VIPFFLQFLFPQPLSHLLLSLARRTKRYDNE
jgi:hypothetical protein